MKYYNIKIIEKSEIKKFIRFIIVGISNTIITLSVIFILSNLFKIDYRISNIIGYFIGLINSFIWNKKWTFKTNNKFRKEIVPFFTMFLISYSINLGIVIFFTEILLFNTNICQIIGMFFYTITNYIGNRYWTFNN